jgi:hypothetical protein
MGTRFAAGAFAADVPVGTNPDGIRLTFRLVEPGRTIPDLTLRLAFSQIHLAFAALRLANGRAAQTGCFTSYWTPGPPSI